MLTSRLRRRAAAAALLPLLGLGCAAPGDNDEEALGTAGEPIASEQLGGVADAVWRHYTDPEIAKSSYASPALFVPGGGQVICSAAMIGPNMMLSAGHCGYGPWTASFLQYPHSNTTDKNFENFDCTYLENTWHSSDLVLYYCAPNAQGVNPGDKYGYFDLDTSPISVGMPVYSIWANPLVNPAPYQYDVRFYSQGTVTATNGYGTFTTDPAHVGLGSDGLPDYTTSYQRPIAVDTNLWCNGGASGSAEINSATHRYLVGPLSQGSVDAPGRYALSMAQYLTDGTVDPRDPLDINSTEISSLGLTPATYGGLLDKDHDGLIDLQRDVERLRGEGARDWYSFSFVSQRQNSLWDVGYWSSATWDTSLPWHQVHLVHTWNGYTDDALIHSRLNLQPGTYRITWQALTGAVNGSSAASSTSNLWVGMTWTGGSSGGFFPTNPAAGYLPETETVTVPAGAANIQLHVQLRDAVDVYLPTMTIAKQGSVMDFNTHDKRYNWRNDINGARGLVVPFVPYGSSPTGTSPGVVNWVARVNYDPSSPLGYPLRNRQIPLDAGHHYQVCFHHVTPPDSSNPSPGARMRVVSGGTEVTSATFSPSSSAWGASCTPTFTPASDDNNMQFGLTTTGSYMVDDITITESP